MLVRILNHACEHVWYKRIFMATHLRVTCVLPFAQRILLRRSLIEHPFPPCVLFRYHAQLVYQVLRGSHIWHRSLETTSQPDTSRRHRLWATPDFEPEDARQVSVSPISKLLRSLYLGTHSGFFPPYLARDVLRVKTEKSIRNLDVGRACWNVRIIIGCLILNQNMTSIFESS